jgi:hypothetical protein
MPSNTTGEKSIAIGVSALNNSTTGVNNVAIGFQSMYSSGTGSNSTAVGYQALSSYTAGDGTAFGYQAALNTTTGGVVVAIGNSALKANTTGDYNTALGYEAGVGLTTGVNNTYLGFRATQSGVAVTGEIVLCTSVATGKGSNTGYINSSSGVYQGNNSAAWSITSDQRLKKNIVDNTDGLSKITQIRVRNFEYRLPEEVTELDANCAIAKTGVQLGVIAQELQAVLPNCVKQESTGVMSVDADNLTWYLVNAIKELKAEFDAYKSTHP